MNSRRSEDDRRDDDERRDRILIRIDELDTKLTARIERLEAFRNVILGGAGVISFFMSLLITYLAK
jgi:hypothetical protein